MLCMPATIGAQNDKPFVIPELKSWKGGKGTFSISEQTRIVYGESAGKELADIARIFAEDLQALSGRRVETACSKVKTGDICLRIKEARRGTSPEAYRIEISDKVIVTANSPIGAYWATRTLLQMDEQSQAWPCGVIDDAPEYALRGFMIDCGRKFIPLEFLQDYVRIMSYYKMNTLQIHLNDCGFSRFFGNDWKKTYAAFRLQSDTYPGLAAEDGYYTKQECIDLQKLAESRGVNIIPEIDAPAHVLAFTQYKPELGSKEFGMDHFDLFNPETYTFMDNLWKEYLEGNEPVFRGKQVHIGTDEYSNKKKEVVEQFRHYTDHYIKYVESFGKQACLWGALTHAQGETPVKSENVLMSAWYNGYAAPKEMVKQGYELISIPDGLVYIVPAAGYYYDFLNTEYLYKKWTPAHVGKEVFEERDPAIRGGMFAVWNDHVGNGISTKDIHYRAFPALQTLATKTWTGAQTTLPYADFDIARRRLSEAPGVNQGGKIGSGKGLVYQQEEVRPGSRLPHREVGQKYRVEFELDGRKETPGTELFRSPHAVFYLSDPISGMMGFARDGYLNTIPYRVKEERIRVRIEGDTQCTRFYINDKLIEEMNITRKYYGGEKNVTHYVRTLVFPLEQAGHFNSRVSRLRIYQEML